MATNPPITIGPFANVPAPGSGVKSDWAQSISTYVAPTVWTAVSFQNAWVNFGAPFYNVAYRKRGDLVELRGLAKTGAVPSVVFTLPAGFRPTGSIQLVCVSNGAFGRATIAADGTVTAAVGSSVNFSFDGMIFSVLA